MQVQGQPDRQTDNMKLIVIFCNFVNELQMDSINVNTSISSFCQ